MSKHMHAPTMPTVCVATVEPFLHAQAIKQIHGPLLCAYSAGPEMQAAAERPQNIESRTRRARGKQQAAKPKKPAGVHKPKKATVGKRAAAPKQTKPNKKASAAKK
mgnify:CR=1 FL=1